jgi:serine/threonine protein kinase/tetratricopeptide (TPR) repeat protein
MGSGRAHRVEQILAEARKLLGDDRAQFIEAVCEGDGELQADIERLLGRGPRLPPDGPSSHQSEKHEPVLGETIPNYRVRKYLGGGGMGMVYEAEDIRLQRPVALKVLPPEYSRDPGAKKRFLLEARAGSALDHQNICTVYEVGEANSGQLFIAMAYYDGVTLNQKISDGALPVDKALDYVIQVAEGLAVAHEHKIVHRDIKPANLMVTAGEVVKILDFGIAMFPGHTRMTRPGAAVGTVAYMAPEHHKRGVIDHRVDVWSLGVVLFELLTAKLPFEGQHPQAVIHSILYRRALPVSFPDGELERRVNQLLQRALEKDPDRRHQTVRELLSDLKAVRELAGGVSPARRFVIPAATFLKLHARNAGILALAILGGVLITRVLTGLGSSPASDVPPLVEPIRIGVALPDDQSRESHASDLPRVIQSLLASELARVPGLAVMDPVSTNALLEGSEASEGGFAYERLAEAGLSYVVWATILHSPVGSEVRYLLVDAKTGNVEFSDSFVSEEEGDVPGEARLAVIQVVEHLDQKVGGITKAKDLQPWVDRAPTPMLALRAFLQGADYAYRGVPGGEEHFRRAVDLDPGFIAARVWLVSSLVYRGETAEAEENVQALRSLMDQASEFEHAMIGWAEALVQGDAGAQVRHLEVATRYAPGNSVLLYNLGSSLVSLGRLEEALEPTRHLVDSGWKHPSLYPLWGWVAIGNGEVEGLRLTLEEALDIRPVDPLLYGMLEVLSLFEGNSEAAEEYGIAFRRRVSEAGSQESPRDMVPAFQMMAEIAGTIGDHDRAVMLLQRASDIDPQDRVVRLELGLFLLVSGNRAESLALYLAVRDSADGTAPVRYLLGKLAHSLGLVDEAIGHFSRYLEIAPDGPEAARAQEGLRLLR